VSLLRTNGLSVGPGADFLVRDLDLCIEPGQCWVVLGRNGAGKSSLLRALAGLIPPRAGTILLGNTAVGRLPPRERARRVGLVFQHSDPGFHSTTLEMALSGGYPHRPGWGWENPAELAAAAEALRAVGLQEQADRPLESLSGGELRRAEIARLLVQRPGLAMLDEPLNHLDIGQQITILSLLLQRCRNAEKALLLVLHDLNLARQVASHALLLHGDGRWQAGDAQTLTSPATLTRLLGYPLQEFDTPWGRQLGIDFHATGLPGQ
jgi:iron complex transport system ATP-binding protein